VSSERKRRICTLLKGIETGDPASVEVINPEKYIQHNPQTHEGRDGLAALFKRLSKSSPRVNIVRVFADGDYVFAHTEYDFSTRRIGFEVFRFEGDQTVEHWDNIQPRRGPNPAGHSMVDGPTEATDPSHTELNRALVRSFVETVLIDRHLERLEEFIDGQRFIQHNPELHDGLPSLRATLEAPAEAGVRYERLHRIVADGDFVLAVSEGSKGGHHSAFYDLFRVAHGKLVEHWDTIETVAPKSEWKNDNGKF
jgi:predicted SnoaL-like aldol condensation-catalyzing enzyme